MPATNTFLELTPNGGDLKILVAIHAICLIEAQNRLNPEAGARLTVAATQPRVPGLSLTLDVQETYEQVRAQLL